jgi:hypothetical protein
MTDNASQTLCECGHTRDQHYEDQGECLVYAVFNDCCHCSAFRVPPKCGDKWI